MGWVEPARIVDLCHWPSVLQSICYVGKRLACRELTNNSFLLPYCMVFQNFKVSSAVPYSCLLFSICNAYAEIGLIFLMYRLFSLCLAAIDVPDCPTFEFLQVLHLSLCIPLEFVLVLTLLSMSWCIVFVAGRAIFKLVCLKRLVIFRICGLWYENFIHFFGLLFCCG
jgi:hypothetical protein